MGKAVRLISLGIDPSYTRSGLVWSESGQVVHHTALTFPQGPKRLLMAMSKIKTVLDKAPRPHIAILEDAAYAAPSRIVVCRLKELSAVFKVVLQGMDVDVLEASPSLVRKWYTGKGNADKITVMQELRAKHGIQFADDKGMDLSDAAILALWGESQRR